MLLHLLLELRDRHVDGGVSFVGARFSEEIEMASHDVTVGDEFAVLFIESPSDMDFSVEVFLKFRSLVDRVFADRKSVV